MQQDFNPDANPFEQILGGLGAGVQGGGKPPVDPSAMMGILGGSGQAPQAPQGPVGPQGAMQTPEMAGMMPEALQPGKTGDGAKALLGAIQNLHNYLAYSTDGKEINMIRQLISMLTQLVARDQTRAAQSLEENQAPATPPTAPPQY